MSAFKALRDVCKSFEEDLKYISKEIFSAKIDEPFEDVIVKRKKDLALFSSKLKLLQAKSIAGKNFFYNYKYLFCYYYMTKNVIFIIHKILHTLCPSTTTCFCSLNFFYLLNAIYIYK